MTFEYLDKIGTAHPEDKILRIFAFDANELVLLSNQIDRLIHGEELVVLDGIVGFKFLNCRLTMVLGKEDHGIHGDPLSLVCELSESTYREMKELILSYSRDASNGGHQWLYDLDCNVDFLLSQSGGW